MITLLKSRALDDVPPRIPRFRLRLLRFSFNIIHVPGKNLVTTDALSRALLPTIPTVAEQTLESECKVYIDSIVQNIPTTKTKLDQIKEAQNKNGICIRLRWFTENGWPENRKAVPENLCQYWAERADLHVADGLLMKG